MNMDNVNKGFTLIELVIVIIILGILAAVAIPKYMQLDQNARISAVNAMEGVLRTTATMVRVTAKARGVAGGVTIIDSTTNAQVNVHATSYYPVANGSNGIVEALETYDGFTTSGTTTVKFTPNSATSPTNCYVSYSLDAAGVPIYTVATSSC